MANIYGYVRGDHFYCFLGAVPRHRPRNFLLAVAVAIAVFCKTCTCMSDEARPMCRGRALKEVPSLAFM